MDTGAGGGRAGDFAAARPYDRATVTTEDSQGGGSGGGRLMSPDDPQLVERIQAGESGALEQLYEMVRNFSFFLRRHLGSQDAEDRLHDVFLSAVYAIQSHRLRDPNR